MKLFMKKYAFLLAVLLLGLVTSLWVPRMGRQAFVFTGKNLLQFLFMLTPVFICIGLLDVWVEKERMMKVMGRSAGLGGVLVAFLLGIVTAVPLYALLPVAGLLLKKGCRVSNVLIFICSCTSVRIPLLLFEVSSMGWKFTAIRFVLNLLVVLFIAFVLEKMLTEKDKQEMYDRANQL